MKPRISTLLSFGRRMYHKSPFTLPIPNCTLTEYIFRDVDKLGTKTALIDGIDGRRWSYRELRAEVGSVTASLQALGVQHGDVVCMCGLNAPEFAHALCGVTATGAALTIANSQLTEGELLQQVQQTGSKLLMVTEDCAKKARNVQSRSPHIQNVIVFGDHAGCIPFSTLLTAPPTVDHVVRIDPASHVALIPFSSGTTGLPKGVQLSHHNLVAELTALRHPSFVPFPAGTSSLSALPMVHIAGLVIGLLNPLSQGAPTVTLPRFEPEIFLTAIQKHRITFSLIAPPIVNFLATEPMADKYDLSSWTTPYSGAAPLGREITERMVQRLGLNGIRQGYGMSEASPATHTTPLEGWKYGSIGSPLPNTESKIVDVKSGETLGPMETGEIWVRGPQVMLGYLNNPGATADTLTHDGWLKTGDIGYYDNDGAYFVSDRLKEIIKYKGYQIAPAYLEEILLSHASVSDAAVVGVPHDVHGHIPTAFVVLNTPADTTEISDYVNDQVAPYKRLRGGVHIVQQLPRSPSGKILRRKLI